jgi:hypothetical protein
MPLSLPQIVRYRGLGSESRIDLEKIKRAVCPVPDGVKRKLQVGFKSLERAQSQACRDISGFS